MTSSPGTRLSDRVTLLRPLGRGGMGSVWTGLLRGHEGEVAVKRIATDLDGHDANVLTRFQRESALAAQLTSPHVVRMLEQGADDEGRPYLVMERLVGETLGSVLARIERLPPNEVVRIVRQVGSVLDEARALGIAHRDIKPENIFLLETDGNLFAKVLDFGIAKATKAHRPTDGTSPGALLGTPEYMSPEQLLSASSADPRSDLWSLAAVAYRALVGRPPFSGETLAALSLAVCHADYEPPSEACGLTADIDVWFARAFNLERAKRFESGEEMARSLEAALGSGDASLVSNDAHVPSTRLSLNVDTHSAPSSKGGTMSGSSAEIEARTGTDARRERRRAGLVVVAACSLATLVYVGWQRAAPPHVASPSLRLPTASDPWLEEEPKAVQAPPTATTARHVASPASSVATVPSARGQRDRAPAAAPSQSTSASSPHDSSRTATPVVPKATASPRLKPGCENPFQLDPDGDLVPKPGCM